MEKAEFYAQARADLAGPLDGVVVVEATTTWAGPMVGCILGDFGATVIKVEHPAGEVMRRFAPMLPGSSLSLAQETVNRNKQSLSLDLQAREGREIFLKLCRRADIVVENFRPGTLAKWGVGYADVAAVKPDIVYVSVSGFGQFGAFADRAGYDPIAQNYCGWTSLNGEPDGGPIKAPTFLGDDLAGIHGALGAMAALRHRDRTGEGQHVDVALVDAMLFQSDGNLTAGAIGMPLKRWGNQFAFGAPVNCYRCTDGDAFVGVLLDSHWDALATLVGRGDLVGVALGERTARREEIDAVIRDWCATRSSADVVGAVTGIGLPATHVNTYADCAREPHVASRDMLQPVRLSDGSEIPLTGPAAKFSRTPTRVRHAAPALGADNAEVLEALGYDAAALARLRREGVI